MRRHAGCRASVAKSIYLIVIAIVTGCERPPAPGEAKGRIENPHVVFVGLPDGDPRWDAVDAGARGLIKNYEGVRLSVLRPLDDSAGAIEGACRNAVQQGAHAVCVWLPRPDDSEGAIQAIVQHGAAAITIGPHVRSEAMFAHVQCSPLDAAEVLGAKLSSVAGESRSYVLLHDSGRSPFDTDVYRRFESGAAGAFGLQKLTEAYAGGGDRAQADEALSEMLGKFPNVGLVVTLDPRIWFSDPEARRLKPSNRYVTLGAPPLLWPALRSGRAAALVGWIEADIGRAAVDFAIRSLGDNRRTGRLLVIPPELITPETLDDFAARYEIAAGREPPTSAPAAKPSP